MVRGHQAPLWAWGWEDHLVGLIVDQVVLGVLVDRAVQEDLPEWEWVWVRICRQECDHRTIIPCKVQDQAQCICKDHQGREVHQGHSVRSRVLQCIKETGLRNKAIRVSKIKVNGMVPLG